MQEPVVIPPSSPLVDPFVFAKHFTVDPSPPAISYFALLSPSLVCFSSLFLFHFSTLDP
jgi:hypothetical protein